MCVCILMMCSKIGVLFLLFFGLPWACANCDVQSLKCLNFFFFPEMWSKALFDVLLWNSFCFVILIK